MSIQNVSNEMQSGAFPAPSATAVKVINVTNTATARYAGTTACLFAYGTSLPNAVAGYLSSCIFLDTDAAADNQYAINEGTLSSCTFTVQTT